MVDGVIIGVSLSEPQCYHVYGGGGGGGGGGSSHGWTMTTTADRPMSQARVMTSTRTSSMGGAQPGWGHL